MLMSSAAALISFPETMMAQAVNGNMLGTITDQSRAAVPGATVTITELESGAIKTTKTNESGVFDFEALQPGTYRVSATLPGHAVLCDRERNHPERAQQHAGRQYQRQVPKAERHRCRSALV